MPARILERGSRNPVFRWQFTFDQRETERERERTFLNDSDRFLVSVAAAHAVASLWISFTHAELMVMPLLLRGSPSQTTTAAIVGGIGDVHAALELRDECSL